ncbi:MAG TPA: protoporphyrinogen oxidase [Candidatus Eremiobacteraceae bacterium]
MTDDVQVDVAVIGAGISGLACAFACQTLGKRVAVFEEATDSGGCIKTLRPEGCIVEGGPQSYLSAPALDDLVDALGLRNKVVAPAAAAKRRYILTRRGLIAVPSSPQSLLFSPLLSAGAKWQLLCEPFVKRRSSDDDESVASFVRRRAGREIADVVAAPFLAGVNAGDPETISMRSAFPALERMEHDHGSLLRALRTTKAPKRRPASFSFAQGNDTLPLALTALLGKSVKLGAPVDRFVITPEGATLSVGGERPEEVRAKRVVIAVPAGAAAELLAPIAPEAARELNAIDYAPVVQLAFVYRRDAIGVPLDGFGFLATKDSGVRVLGAVWNSVAYPKHCAEGDALVTAFFGGALDPTAAIEADDELLTIAHADLRRAMKISGAKPRLAAVFRWDTGIPQYNIGHEVRLRSIEASLARLPEIALCGNFLRGISVGDCVRQAREVALRLTGAGSAGARHRDA